MVLVTLARMFLISVILGDTPTMLLKTAGAVDSPCSCWINS